MDALEWSRQVLGMTVCEPAVERGCCAPAGCPELSLFDFREPRKLWIGYSMCPKHAEMLKRGPVEGRHVTSQGVKGWKSQPSRRPTP